MNTVENYEEVEAKIIKFVNVENRCVCNVDVTGNQAVFEWNQPLFDNLFDGDQFTGSYMLMGVEIPLPIDMKEIIRIMTEGNVILSTVDENPDNFLLSGGLLYPVEVGTVTEQSDPNINVHFDQPLDVHAIYVINGRESEIDFSTSNVIIIPDCGVEDKFCVAMGFEEVGGGEPIVGVPLSVSPEQLVEIINNSELNIKL